MDSTQPDRDTELAPSAENPNVGVSENPFDASSAIEQHILIGLEKLGWRWSVLAGCWTTRFNTDSRTNPGASD